MNDWFTAGTAYINSHVAFISYDSNDVKNIKIFVPDW